MAVLLAPAGLRFVQRIRDEVRLPPLPPGHSPASAGPEHGRFDSGPDEIADVDAPNMADKVNASWYRMATEYGLFDEDREFLLGVDYTHPAARHSAVVDTLTHWRQAHDSVGCRTVWANLPPAHVWHLHAATTTGSTPAPGSGIPANPPGICPLRGAGQACLTW